MAAVDQSYDKDLFQFKYLDCKSFYFSNTIEDMEYVRFAQGIIAKPYFNFHLEEHASMPQFNVSYPTGLEMIIDFTPAFGYKITPERFYTMGYVKDTVHKLANAKFTLLSSYYLTMKIRIFHRILLTILYNKPKYIPGDVIGVFRDEEQITLHYLTYKCLRLFKNKEKQISDVLTRTVCPNPCTRTDLCHNKQNTQPECTPTGVGIEDYQCACNSGYTWDSMSKSCVQNSWCQRCDKKNTRHCKFIPGIDSQGEIEKQEAHFLCLCKIGYYGELCKEILNPCLHHRNGQPPGMQMCLNAKGNECIPQIGTPHYRCQCREPYQQDFNRTDSNCFKKISKCDSLLCQNDGQCFSSSDGKNHICYCPPGYKGELCEVVDTVSWKSWEDWSYCDSVCGVGWRVRHRHCVDRATLRHSKTCIVS